MFGGITLLCLGHHPEKDFWEECLHKITVPRKLWLKAANVTRPCPMCGLRTRAVGNLFRAAARLSRAEREFQRTSFFLNTYATGVSIRSEPDDETDWTAHILTEVDWGVWNMQIANIQIAHLDGVGIKLDLWEDVFFHAKPYRFPREDNLTFTGVMRRKRVHGLDDRYEVRPLHLLKDLIRQIREYNKAWKALHDERVNAAPVDLEHPLSTHLARVTNLADLFPRQRYE